MYNEIVGSKNYVITQDPETREDLLMIDRQTKEDLREIHRLYLNNDWECNTITYVTIETLVKILHAHIKDHGVDILESGGNEINFYDILEMSASNKKNEDAEKTGNINVSFWAGEKVADIVSEDTLREQQEVDFVEISAAYSYPEDSERTRAMLKIDNLARRLLSDRYAIVLPKDYMAIAPTYLFLKNLYRVLTEKLVNSGKGTTTINFNDIIEFHAVKSKDNGIDIHLRPGMAAKLIIKSDEVTEDDD